MNAENNDSLTNQPSASSNEKTEPQAAPEPPKATIRADAIVVLCALPSGAVHEVALTKQMRATVLSLLVQMHGGELKLVLPAIEGLTTTTKPIDQQAKPQGSGLILPPSGIVKARR